MKNAKKTRTTIASLAGKTLGGKDGTAEEKSLAGSALAQSRTTKTTSKKMETEASRVLRNKDSSRDGKSLAGSLVSQSNLKP